MVDRSGAIEGLFRKSPGRRWRYHEMSYVVRMNYQQFHETVDSLVRQGLVESHGRGWYSWKG